MKHIGSNSELNSVLASAGSKLVVVDFFATWCGPCKVLAPMLEALEKKHTTTVFAKVDVDAAGDCSKTHQVTAMPTIVFFKSKSEVGRVVGANIGEIKSLIARHEGGSSFSGSGQTLGGGSSSSSSSSGAVKDTPKNATATNGSRASVLDNQPYHIRLLTAATQLASGLFTFCSRCLQGLLNTATAAKTGLIGDHSQLSVPAPGGSCTLNIKLPDGSNLLGQFEPTHTIAQVQEFVQANLDVKGLKAPGFALMTNFPRVVYEKEALQQTLDEAKLTPRAQLFVKSA